MPTYAASSSGGSSAGTDKDTSLLAVAKYNPGAFTTFNTTSGTASDVDATNLVLPQFTVPSTGSVIVVLSAFSRHTTSGTGYWLLREGTTTVTDSDAAFEQIDDQYERKTVRLYLTGLTAGATPTWKWGFKTSGAGTSYLAAGGGFGMATMEVWSVGSSVAT